MRYYKCLDCWRCYSETYPQEHPEWNGCKCVSIRFKDKPESFWIKVKAWLTNYL